MILWFLFFSLLMWCIKLINFQIYETVSIIPIHLPSPPRVHPGVSWWGQGRAREVMTRHFRAVTRGLLSPLHAFISEKGKTELPSPNETFLSRHVSVSPFSPPFWKGTVSTFPLRTELSWRRHTDLSDSPNPRHLHTMHAGSVLLAKYWVAP